MPVRGSQNRVQKATLPALVLAAWAAGSVQSLAQPPFEPLRPADARARNLVETAVRKSPTVGALVHSLALSDVLVVIQVIVQYVKNSEAA